MDDDKMIEFAEAEVKRLRAELEKTPAYKRLKAAEDLIATYRGNPEAAPRDEAVKPMSHEPSLAAMNNGSSEHLVRGHQTKTAMVEAAAAEFLIQKGRRATSGEILPAVTAKGITVPGKMPSKTISAYLSTSKRFDNVPGFGGYGLVEWNGRRTAPQAADAEPAAGTKSSELFN